MDNTLGRKMTFWSLLDQKITIPTLQRDYIYGAGTDKTEEVLCNMLATFQNSIDNNREETLDFVYGSDSKEGEFMPLDGQQRLTTLFLLHFYAALISDDSTEADFAKLGGFSYATRNCTVAFCKNLLVRDHKQLSRVVIESLDNPSAISRYLEEQNDFRGSFYTDPSVMSMMVVLDRIHQTFAGYKGMWKILTSDECPINFYILDFGRFDLSDDLYNKMNSRGKPLTAFEIFKAKMHKQILGLMPKMAELIAIKLDTDWMQLVWDILNRTKELKKVDPAYMCILRNVFRIFDYIAGYESQRFEALTDECLEVNMMSTSRICAMKEVFDVFNLHRDRVPDSLNKELSELLETAAKRDLVYRDILLIYAFFVGIRQSLTLEEMNFRLRHIVNLRNNSQDQIREDNMNNLLRETKWVMQGKIQKNWSKGYNQTQWEEEQEKDAHREEWSKLFVYEDIKEISGCLNAFCSGLNSKNSLDLSDTEFVAALSCRLAKAKFFFESTEVEEVRRAILLSVGDYSMYRVNWPGYRYFGIIQTSWENFIGHHKFGDRSRIMGIFDRIDTSRPLSVCPDAATTENWRYYAIKYAKEITVGYRSPNYGYMYMPSVTSSATYGPEQGNLDLSILQSGYFSQTNVAWKMLNKLVEVMYGDMYHLYLDIHGGAPIILSKIGSGVLLDIQEDGWHISGLTADDILSAGIEVVEIDQDNFICAHALGRDYVEEGGAILEKLSVLYPELKK